MRGAVPYPQQRFPPRPFCPDPARAPGPPSYGFPPGNPGQFPPQQPFAGHPDPRYGPPRPARPPFHQQGPPYGTPFPGYHDPNVPQGPPVYQTSWQGLPLDGRFETMNPGAGAYPSLPQPGYHPGMTGPQYPGQTEAGFSQFGPWAPPSAFFDNSGANQTRADSQASQGNQMQQLFEAVTMAEHEEQFEQYLNKWEAYYTAYREQCRSTQDAVSFEASNQQFQAYLDYLKQYRTALAQKKAARIAVELAAVPPPPPPPPAPAPVSQVQAPKPEPQFLRAPAVVNGATSTGQPGVRPAGESLRMPAPTGVGVQAPPASQPGYQQQPGQRPPFPNSSQPGQNLSGPTRVDRSGPLNQGGGQENRFPIGTPNQPGPRFSQPPVPVDGALQFDRNANSQQAAGPGQLRPHTPFQPHSNVPGQPQYLRQPGPASNSAPPRSEMANLGAPQNQPFKREDGQFGQPINRVGAPPYSGPPNQQQQPVGSVSQQNQNSFGQNSTDQRSPASVGGNLPAPHGGNVKFQPKTDQDFAADNYGFDGGSHGWEEEDLVTGNDRRPPSHRPDRTRLDLQPDRNDYRRRDENDVSLDDADREAEWHHSKHQKGNDRFEKQQEDRLFEELKKLKHFLPRRQPSPPPSHADREFSQHGPPRGQLDRPYDGRLPHQDFNRGNPQFDERHAAQQPNFNRGRFDHRPNDSQPPPGFFSRPLGSDPALDIREVLNRNRSQPPPQGNFDMQNRDRDRGPFHQQHHHPPPLENIEDRDHFSRNYGPPDGFDTQERDREYGNFGPNHRDPPPGNFNSPDRGGSLLGTFLPGPQQFDQNFGGPPSRPVLAPPQAPVFSRTGPPAAPLARPSYGPPDGSYDGRLRNQFPAGEPYRDPAYQIPPARHLQARPLVTPLKQVEDSGQKHLSPEVVSKVGHARRLMEALSQSRPVSVNELLCIINSVKTETLITQPTPQQPAPSLESELSSLLRQIQAVVAPGTSGGSTVPSAPVQQQAREPEQMGQPIQRLISQQSRPSPVDAMESSSSSATSPPKQLFRGVTVPATTSNRAPPQPEPRTPQPALPKTSGLQTPAEARAAHLAMLARGESQPEARAQSKLFKSALPSEPAQAETPSRNLVTPRKLPETPVKPLVSTGYQNQAPVPPASPTPLVDNAVMNELGMNEGQVMQAMERVKAMFGNLVGPEQTAKLMALMQSTVAPAPKQAPPTVPSASAYRPPSSPSQYTPPRERERQSSRDRDRDRDYDDRRRDRTPERRRDRTPERRRRSRSASRDRNYPVPPPTVPGDRRVGLQGFFAKALQQRGLPMAPSDLQGPVVPPGLTRHHGPGVSEHRSADRPSQQGQGTELRCSLTPLDDLIPRTAATQKKLAILLRGPPGSGKSWVAKKIKEKEPNARILSIDDYFEVERVDEVDAKGRHTTRKAGQYQYDEKLEGRYRQELEKLFRKKTEDPYCTCLVVDACNEKLAFFMDMVMYGTRNGFEVFVGEMPLMKPYELERKSTHFRSASDIAEIVRNWEPTPSSLFRVDLRKVVAEMPVWTSERPKDLPARVSMKFSGWKVPSKSKWEVDDEDDQPEVKITIKGTEWVEKDTGSTKKTKEVDWVEKSTPAAKKTDDMTESSVKTAPKDRKYRSRSRSPSLSSKKKH